MSKILILRTSEQVVKESGNIWHEPYNEEYYSDTNANALSIILQYEHQIANTNVENIKYALCTYLNQNINATLRKVYSLRLDNNSRCLLVYSSFIKELNRSSLGLDRNLIDIWRSINRANVHLVPLCFTLPENQVKQLLANINVQTEPTLQAARRYYIFMCNSNYAGEFLSEGIFGARSEFHPTVRIIRPGDFIFLWYRDLEQLFGIFKATTQGQLNINPDAFDRNYPSQVRVDWFFDFRVGLSKNELNDLQIFNPNRHPRMKISEEDGNKLIQKLSEKNSAPQMTREQLKTEGIKTEDGHRVESQCEVRIDDFFYKNNILHAYNIRVPIHEDMYCDWYLKRADLYVEFWGFNSDEYRRRRDHKKELYRRYKKQLLSIYPEDCRNLDETLKNKLLPYGYTF